jgi:hypothetical protein
VLSAEGKDAAKVKWVSECMGKHNGFGFSLLIRPFDLIGPDIRGDWIAIKKNRN